MSRVWLKSRMKEMNIIIRNARVYKLFLLHGVFYEAGKNAKNS